MKILVGDNMGEFYGISMDSQRKFHAFGIEKSGFFSPNLSLIDLYI